MKLENEKKVIGTLLNGLNAVSLDLSLLNMFIDDCVATGDYKKGIEYAKIALKQGSLNDDDYRALMFVFVNADLLYNMTIDIDDSEVSFD